MKPIVHYISDDVSAQNILEIGFWAWIRVVDHPNHKPFTLVKTSSIVAIMSGGVFETLNTIYYPM